MFFFFPYPVNEKLIMITTSKILQGHNQNATEKQLPSFLLTCFN